MITQLCAGIAHTPDPVLKLYTQCGGGTQQPVKESLFEALVAFMLEYNDRTYLIIDALDECGELEELLNLISKIASDCLTSMDVRLYMTSRKEKVIREALEDSIEKTVFLQGKSIDDDIMLHVRKSLECDKRLQKWPTKVRNEIHDGLVRGAHGM